MRRSREPEPFRKRQVVGSKTKRANWKSGAD
jgi:hypothetical protein